ncbi:MAG: FAD-dependent oxidoreductase, partial [Phycisphaerales bacterium]|nr:FAD-dependent oxidoreductase [Phycisphaerales bacterium]
GKKPKSLSSGQGPRGQRHPPPGGGGGGLIKKFYDPILVSALNEETRRVSAKYAIQVFQDAMLAHSRGYLIGLANCPLSELYTTLPPRIRLYLNTRVDEILFSTPSTFSLQRSPFPPPPRAIGVKLRNGKTLAADAVILATNHHAVQNWIPEPLKQIDTRFPPLSLLQSVPILGVHLFFDRPVMRIPAAALIEGPLQWLFRKDTGIERGRALHGVISVAHEWSNIPRPQALQLFESQIRRLLPPSDRSATLTRSLILIDKRATFAPLPNTDPLRPQQAPPPNGIQSLYLAGDYTKTDWPATMEGATRSGYLAAEALLANLGSPTKLLQPDLPTQWPARLLGL